MANFVNLLFLVISRGLEREIETSGRQSAAKNSAVCFQLGQRDKKGLALDRRLAIDKMGFRDLLFQRVSQF